MKKEIIGRESFESSSSSKVYEVLTYTDGTTSCNCKGWTRRVAEEGSRSCKHTRAVEEAMKYTLPTTPKAALEELKKAIVETGHFEGVIRDGKCKYEEVMVPVSEGVSIEKEIAPKSPPLTGSVVMSIKF